MASRGWISLPRQENTLQPNAHVEKQFIENHDRLPNQPYITEPNMNTWGHASTSLGSSNLCLDTQESRSQSSLPPIAGIVNAWMSEYGATDDCSAWQQDMELYMCRLVYDVRASKHASTCDGNGIQWFHLRFVVGSIDDVEKAAWNLKVLLSLSKMMTWLKMINSFKRVEVVIIKDDIIGINLLYKIVISRMEKVIRNFSLARC